jgi:hypothetical protein
MNHARTRLLGLIVASSIIFGMLINEHQVQRFRTHDADM